MEGVTPITADSLVVQSDDAVAADVDGEVVALNVMRGYCYSLNGTGSRIWQLAAAPIAVSEICTRLADEFDVDSEQCRSEVLELLEGLRAEGMITPVTDQPAASAGG